MTVENFHKASVLIYDIDKLIRDLEDLKKNGLNPDEVKEYLGIDWIRDVLTEAVIKATEARLAEKKREFEKL